MNPFQRLGVKISNWWRGEPQDSGGVAWLARVISFEAFSMMVDEALERMKKMLESNKAMQTLVSGEAGEVNE